MVILLKYTRVTEFFCIKGVFSILHKVIKIFNTIVQDDTHSCSTDRYSAQDGLTSRATWVADRVTA